MSKPIGNTTTYDLNSDNFAVSPSLVLGHLFQQYHEQLYLLALSTPADYSACRADVIQKVKIGVVNQIYIHLHYQ